MRAAELQGLRELQEQYPNHVATIGQYGEAVLTPVKDVVHGTTRTLPEVDRALDEWKVNLNSSMGQATLLGLELEGAQ
jgi:hypothetical protein